MRTETKVGVGCLAIGLPVAGYGIYQAIKGGTKGLQKPTPFVVAGGILITAGAISFIIGA